MVLCRATSATSCSATRPREKGRQSPWEFLAGRKGYVQADAASVFDRLFNGQVASATEVGCWAHARRRLVALKDMVTAANGLPAQADRQDVSYRTAGGCEMSCRSMSGHCFERSARGRCSTSSNDGS